MPMKLNIGDIVQTKKNHPCGGNQWEITRRFFQPICGIFSLIILSASFKISVSFLPSLLIHAAHDSLRNHVNCLLAK